MATSAPDLVDAARWRLIGPFRGGRVVAVAGHPTDHLRFYFGSTGGGVWRTDDAGLTWTNVSDGFFKRASVGAIAIAPSNPNVIYVGMGESCIRSNVSPGDGVYRSLDGGLTWAHCGLEPTRHIGRLRVDPHDPDIVYVAALGHAHGSNPERGVYRTRDGGANWDLVLHHDQDTGAVDLVVDPENQRLLYASLWQTRRLPWTLVSGGAGSGIHRSDDGGDSWVDLTRKPGLPDGVLGRIGLTASAAAPGRLWAIVEAVKGGLFRSDDRGEHWQRMTDKDEIRLRPWYYQHIFADPMDGETIWALNIDMWRSTDGGSSFDKIPQPHGDAHDLWLDPTDPKRLLLGSDGGANVSFNGGLSWSTCYNQPTAELYHVTTDSRTPYRVYASQQDNSSISLPSQSELGAITQTEIFSVGGGETGYIAVRPDEPDVIYAGNYAGQITRFDRRLRYPQWIPVWPEPTWGEGAEAARYRFAWTAPILLSPHDPNVLYQAGDHVFRSTDEGVTWTPISPDLTRNDRSKQGLSGGPITPDNSGAEYFCTVFALAESQRQTGELWAGSDDGLVHVTRNGGQDWVDVTPPDLPEWAKVSVIETSPHRAGTAYLVAERHLLDDFNPYLWRTSDHGQSWERIDEGLPADEFCRVLREDPVRPDLLYCGTEAGLHVSFDGGTHWRSLRGNLPVVPIHDLAVNGDDLIAATHGRSIWILGDLAMLRAFDEGQLANPVVLYAPGTVHAFRTRPDISQSGDPGRFYANVGVAVVPFDRKRLPGGDGTEVTLLDAGENPVSGVPLLFWLREAVADGALRLSIRDQGGEEIRSYSAEPAKQPGGDEDKPEAAKDARPTAMQGLNRFVWDMRRDRGAIIEIDPPREFEQIGPLVPPGVYEARLELANDQVNVRFEILPDPRSGNTANDHQARYQLSLKIWRRICDLNEAVNRIRRMRRDLEPWSKGKFATQAKTLREELLMVEKELVTDLHAPPLEKPSPKLIGKLQTVFEFSELPARPTPALVQVSEELFTRLDLQLDHLRALVEGPLVELNTAIKAAGAPAIPVGEA